MKLGIRDAILVSFFTALMVVGAYVRIPLPFLPVTLQPFFCAFAGLLLGSRLGSLSQLLYILLGLLGLPVFAQGAGISYVLEPSFGFLLGFVACAYIIGKISEGFVSINLKRSLISIMAGFVALYFIGIVYMFFILKFYTHNAKASIGFVAVSNLPYMIKDLILYVIVALSVSSVHPVLQKAGLMK